MNRKIFASMLTVVSLVAAVGAGTLAIFRDTESIRGNTISAGVVDISLSNGSGQFPSPIVAEDLAPGEVTDWSRVLVTNSSESAVKLYFYVTDVEGKTCAETTLDVATGPMDGNEQEFNVFAGNLYDIKGIDNRVEVTGHVFDPHMAAEAVAAVSLRAGIDDDASGRVMGKSCSWTGVFVAEASAEEDEPDSTPVEDPGSTPSTDPAL